MKNRAARNEAWSPLHDFLSPVDGQFGQHRKHLVPHSSSLAVRHGTVDAYASSPATVSQAGSGTPSDALMCTTSHRICRTEGHLYPVEGAGDAGEDDRCPDRAVVTLPPAAAPGAHGWLRRHVLEERSARQGTVLTGCLPIAPSSTLCQGC